MQTAHSGGQQNFKLLIVFLIVLSLGFECFLSVKIG